MAEEKGITIKWSSIWQAVIVASIMGAFTWAWTLESRLVKIESSQNVVKRVERLEEMILPVLTEYRMRERLREMGHQLEFSTGYQEGPAYNPPEDTGYDIPAFISRMESDEFAEELEPIEESAVWENNEEMPIYKIDNMSAMEQRALYEESKKDVKESLKKGEKK